MLYQVSFWDIIKAWFIPLKLSFLAIPLGIIVLAIVVAFRLKSAGISGGELLGVAGFFAIAILGPLVVLALVYAGSGVRLEDARLLVKIGIGSPRSIILENARVALAETGGMWEVTLRKNGIGLPGFSAGLFRFRNGKSAFYFRHGESSYNLVLGYEGTYYVLSFPGMEKFYREILARGAQGAEDSSL